MFRNSNETIDINELGDFIEKPDQNCDQAELENGINKVLIVLENNPEAIMNIIADSYAPAFLLDDLAAKMKTQNCLEKLGVLFEKCGDQLIDLCSYNIHDLARCTNAMPAHLDKIMQHVVSRDDWMKRILQNDNDPEETLNEIGKCYPVYLSLFSECRNKHLKTI